MTLRTFKQLTGVTVLLAFVVIALGAFTRLNDAGLSCPDWPGCYGHLAPSSSMLKAWMEMIHRYCAGTLALFILVLVLGLLIQHWRRLTRGQVAILFGLFALLLYQPLLGMWTVTLKLLPIIVTQHLLGGLGILSLLWLLFLSLRAPAQFVAPVSVYYLSRIALFFLALQLILGAWTSTNYAAISCPNFPFCQLAHWSYHFSEALQIRFAPGNYQGGVLSEEARRTIQMMHRWGAFLFSLSVFAVLIGLYRETVAKPLQTMGAFLAFFWILQIALGIANAVFARPLVIAVLHNQIAAWLLLTLLTLVYYSQKEGVCTS